MTTRSKKKLLLKSLKKLKTFWHPESTLVYKSKKERLVIGRYVDSEFIPLDEEALELCEEWNMKPDESLIEDEEDDQHDGEESEASEASEGGEGGGGKSSHDDDDGKEETQTPPEVKETKPASAPPAETTFTDIQRVVTQYNTHSESFIAELMKWYSECESSRVAELAAKQSEYDDLKSKYDVIKKKFDTMKSLFA